MDYIKWFEALILAERNTDNSIKKQIYLPEINDITIRTEKFSSLRDSISRFLESYGNNVGLNFLSGLVRLFTNEYQDSDGINRFESALNAIKVNFSRREQDDIFEKILEVGIYLNENSKLDFCDSIVKLYPNKIEYLSEYYGLPHLLNDKIAQKIEKLKELNIKLNEQLTKI